MSAIRDKVYHRLSRFFSDSHISIADQESQARLHAKDKKWRSKTSSLKLKPLDRSQSYENFEAQENDIYGGHLEDSEPGLGGSTSSCPDACEDALTRHSFEKVVPRAVNESVLIYPQLHEFLETSLPNIVKGCQWALLYSTARHGISLKTLIRKSADLSGPCLLITGDKKGAIFGGLLDCPVKVTSKRKYQGTNQSFVFTTIYGEPKVFRATGANRYFCLCLNEFLAFGGGASFALRLNEDLLSGSSGTCETFGNSCLANDQEFELKDVELWGFTHTSQYLT